jgi:hypothetical protein
MVKFWGTEIAISWPQVAVRLSADWRPAPVEGLPAVFTGGWVGYCGYDTVRYVYAGAWTPKRLPVLEHTHELATTRDY